MGWRACRLVASNSLQATLSLAGCGTSDKLVGRYRTANCETIRQPLDDASKGLPSAFLLANAGPAPCDTVVPTASASAISIATPSSAPSEKTGADLPERALAAYIAALARMTPNADKLRAAIAAHLTDTQSKEPAIEDRTVFKRTLIVTTRLEGGFNPTDRLESTDILIRPYGARFTEWDLLATTQVTVDAGSVQLTRGRTTTQSLSAAAPAGAPVSATATAGATQTDTRAEQFNARAIIPNTSATVDDLGNLRITRRGGFGIDLTDNAVIRVTMRYTGETIPGDGGPANRVFGSRFIGTFFDKGRRLDNGKAKLSPTLSFTVPNDTSIAADVYLNYTIRHVSAGADTYEEKDDDTLDRTIGPVRQRTTLISAGDASTAGYAVQVGADGGRRISVKQAGRPAEGLCFASQLTALDFIAFMKTAPVAPPRTVGGYAVGLVRPEVNLTSPLPLNGTEAQDLRLHSGC